MAAKPIITANPLKNTVRPAFLYVATIASAVDSL
ncbi:Uncharacterised protein [Mycobacteroides abscessus subsp. abscessus]|nr:Uncharacterised protein [Mycobacteroides abscessus subsp. abscessus]